MWSMNLKTNAAHDKCRLNKRPINKRRLIAGAAMLSALIAGGCQAPNMLGGAGMASNRAAIAEEMRNREMRLAAAARNSGQPETALSIYQKLKMTEPDSMLIQTALAETLFEMKAKHQALAAFNKAILLESASPQVAAGALSGRGRTLLALGQAEQAEADFTAALNILPANPVALNGQAVANDLQGRHGAAQALYQQALAHDPGNPRIQSNLGLSYALAARFNDAVAQLAPIASARGPSARARHNLALTFGLMGRPEQAELLTRGDLDPSSSAGNNKFYNLMQGAVGHGSSDDVAPATPPAIAAQKPIQQSETATQTQSYVSSKSAQPVESSQNYATSAPSHNQSGASYAIARPSATSSADLITPPDLVSLQELRAEDPAYAQIGAELRRDEATGVMVFGPELNLLETTPGQD